MIRAFFLAILIFANIPNAQPGHLVHDFVGVLSQQSKQELEFLLRRVEAETTAEVAVVVVESLEGQDVDSYAHQLFNDWGIGKSATNNGVLFLIAPTERRTRIEVGYGLEPLLSDGLSGEILDAFVVPFFKAGDMPGGIVSGAKEIARILQKYPEAARGIPGSAPRSISSPRKDAALLNYSLIGGAIVLFIIAFTIRRREVYGSTVFMVLSILILGLGAYSSYSTFALSSPIRPWLSYFGGLGASIFAFIFNVRQFNRYGPRKCKHCGSLQTLLSESKDDANLTEIQKLEEKLGSVDYDVWICSACLKSDVERYVSYFSGFSACPQCKNQTYKETSTTAIPATRMSTGLLRISGECVSCNHKSSRTQIIPRISASPSSGSSGGSRGGGFGGGSSGGGGASRGW